MTEDQRRILQFCIGEWRHLVSLETEIPRSTLYRVAKDLCGRRWLIHRRAKGYRATQRGIQILQEDRPQVVTFEEGTFAEKIQLEEGKRQIASKKLPVNLAAIQKLLQLSDKTINSFLSLYPPLSKVPTPTHEATIELLWAEVCDRKWPVTNDHHLTFANFADIFAWKTNSAKFCAHMAVGKDITPCIIDLAVEGGCSLWVRKTAGGTIIFKREILEGPFLCLDDYHKADSQAQKAAGHLLTGSIQIPLENQIQTIRCVSLVNLNPKKGATISDKTGFDRALIRRLIPCNLDAIELPDLKKIGEEALDATKIFGRLKIEKPTSTCRQCREELIHYYKKLFTKEGQNLIDIDGLLNIARGFTGYGLTPSEAVRYVLYKASLPYHTVGWLRPEWVQGFGKERPATKIKKTLIPKMKIGKEDRTQNNMKQFQTEIQLTTEFDPKYRTLITLVEEKIKLLQRIADQDFRQSLLLGEEEKFTTAFNVFKLLEKKLKEVNRGDYHTLNDLKVLTTKLTKEHFLPIQEISQKARMRAVSEKLLAKITEADSFNNLINALENVDNTSLSEELKLKLLNSGIEKYNKFSAKVKQELISYLRREDIPTKDITEELINLRLVKKVTSISGRKELEDINGNSYPIDEFDFSKYQPEESSLNTFAVGRCKKEALSLLTGGKEKSHLDYLLQMSRRRSDRRAQQKKAELEKKAEKENDALERLMEWTSEKIKRYFSNRKKAARQIENFLSTGCYIQTKKGLTQAKLIGKEDNWLLFQLKDGQEWKLPHSTTRVTVLLKPEYGGQTYQFVRQEGGNLIVRVDEKDERIPINQVDKVIYNEESKSEVNLEPKTTVHYQNYYKGRPVQIICQTEYSYTIRNASGEDISVLKDEVIVRERLEFWKESHTKIEIRTMSGKTYQGNIDILEKEYFCLHQDPNTHIFIDKIESIKEVY